MQGEFPRPQPHTPGPQEVLGHWRRVARISGVKTKPDRSSGAHGRGLLLAVGPEGGLGDLREAELSQIGDNGPPTPSDVAIEGENELCLATLISTFFSCRRS